MLELLNNHLEHWYPTWWSLLFILETFFGAASFYILVKEYKYDEAKDLAKKQRRTKTTKKTTRNPGGIEITEESSEITEPTNEETKA
jgi:hypothetical protein